MNDSERKVHMMADAQSKPVLGERKRDRFVRLAESRTSNALRAIRTIAKLGNRSQYDFDESDIRKIAAALTKEVDAMKVRMGDPGARDTVEFKL